MFSTLLDLFSNLLRLFSLLPEGTVDEAKEHFKK